MMILKKKASLTSTIFQAVITDLMLRALASHFNLFSCLLGDHQGKFYFDTHCPFGLWPSAMICQCMTKAIAHTFTEQGFLADVCLDDFYAVECPSLPAQAFSCLSQIFQHLSLNSLPEKDSPPLTSMICLRILIATATLILLLRFVLCISRI